MIDIKVYSGKGSHIDKMFNKKNILKHSAVNPNFPQIAPAKKFVPDWYRSGKRVNEKDESNTEKLIRSFPIKMGFKMCVPFQSPLLMDI